MKPQPTPKSVITRSDAVAESLVPGLPPAVEVQGLTVERGRTMILQGVDCVLPRGACTVLLGPNGCGKTTLTRCLTGHMFATQGSVRVLGETVGETDIRLLRRRVSVVNPVVDAGGAHVAGAVVDADLPTLDAVLTGFFSTVWLYDTPTPEQRARAEQVLQQVGLSHRMEHRLSLLSTGEQRRALLARALVHRPELLILDEPTAGLDVAGREQVLATIHALLQPTQAGAPAELPGPAPTVLLITHHVEEIPLRTAQVLLMRDGKILRHGAPQEVITPEALSQTFGCKVYVRRVHGRWWLEVLPEAWLELGRDGR